MLVVVAGAESPLGMSMLELLLAREHTVVAVAARPHRIPAFDDLRVSYERQLHTVEGDVSNPGLVAPTISRIRALPLGSANALIYASVARQAAEGLVDVELADSLEGVNETSFHALQNANALAPLVWCRAMAPLIASADFRRIVVTVPWLASIAGKSMGGDYAYCASLASRLMMVRALAADLRASGITTFAVNPGNYKVNLEGPAFQHDVATAARGVVDLALQSPANPQTCGDRLTGRWFDWNGAERTS